MKQILNKFYTCLGLGYIFIKLNCTSRRTENALNDIRFNRGLSAFWIHSILTCLRLNWFTKWIWTRKFLYQVLLKAVIYTWFGLNPPHCFIQILSSLPHVNIIVVTLPKVLCLSNYTQKDNIVIVELREKKGINLLRFLFETGAHVCR